MKIGDCKETKNGQTYCKFADNRVRFVSRSDLGMPMVAGAGTMKMLPGLAGGRKRRSRKMKIGECRRTRNGVKYCKTRKGVRFKRG